MKDKIKHVAKLAWRHWFLIWGCYSAVVWALDPVAWRFLLTLLYFTLWGAEMVARRLVDLVERYREDAQEWENLAMRWKALYYEQADRYDDAVDLLRKNGITDIV